MLDEDAAAQRDYKGYESMDDFVVVSRCQCLYVLLTFEDCRYSDEEWSDDCPSDEFGAEAVHKTKKKGKGKNKKNGKIEVPAAITSTEADWFHDILTQSNADFHEPGASGKIVSH